MTDVIVIRPGTQLWTELAAMRASGEWRTAVLPDAVARELGLEPGTVGVGALVSTYIGETEKNLSAVFTRAESTEAVLLFDEADALFGRRSEVKDAHDRFADLETSFLLSRLEIAQAVPLVVRRNRQRSRRPRDPE
ncbi:MAG TPA: AAA family ATPase [Microbacterium sp.]|nr:AAA family ATPase [Microbacterium sp.]